MLIMSIRQVYIKYCSFVQCARGSNYAIMVFDYPFNDSKPNSRTFILCFAVQTLEYFKDLFVVFRFKAYAVVGNANVVVRLCQRELLHVYFAR